MKRAWRKPFWIILLVLLLSFLVSLISATREPTYNGRTLSEWARQYGSNHWSAANREADAEAEAAIRAIGTNAFPCLLGQLQTKESAFKRSARRILPARWHNRLRLRDESGQTRRVGAHGFAALGTNAGAVVPQLIEIARNHPEEDGRYVAVFALRTLGDAAIPAIPFFIECLTNQTAIIRSDAALGLGYVRHNGIIVVPALISYLDTADTSTRTHELTAALGSLERFGSEAKSAVPEVLPLLTHEDWYVRETATNCLLQIDPETATQAGVKRRQD